MDEPDSGYRFICIRGARGVGKTSFLLDFVAEHYGESLSCLYVNLNHFYFAQHTLYDFARQFYTGRGRLLLLDQVFKYPNWQEELRRCYTDFPELKVLFTVSSVVTLREELPELSDFVKVYDLRGFSFREYCGLTHNVNLPVYSLSDIIEHHTEIAAGITNDYNPLATYEEYLRVGFYPFSREKTSFVETLVKTMNMTLEVDVVYIHQIEPAYLYKLRKLLYLISGQSAVSPNISELSKEIGTSRATVMNYLKYLSDAGMIHLMYKKGDEYPKKPNRIFLNNTNISYSMYPNEPTADELRRIFFVSQLSPHYKVNMAEGAGGEFLVDDKYRIHTTDIMRSRVKSDTYFAVDNLAVGRDRRIPIWLFGLLY